MAKKPHRAVRKNTGRAPSKVTHTSKRRKVVLRRKGHRRADISPMRRGGLDTTVSFSGRVSAEPPLSLAQQEIACAAREVQNKVKVSGRLTAEVNIPPGPWCVQLPHDVGLCNKLRGLVSIAAIADECGMHVGLSWAPGRACTSVFDDIFIPDNVAIVSDIDWQRLPIKWRLREAMATTVREKYYDIFVEKTSRDMFFYRVRQRMLALRLQPHLEQRLREFLLTIPDGTIGVHIRRTDFSAANSWSDEMLRNQLNDILAEQPDATFMVCADNKQSVDMMFKHYGDRTFWRKQDLTPGKLRHSTCGDAAIDLYSLAYMSAVVGHGRSSFAGYAAHLGDIPLLRSYPIGAN